MLTGETALVTSSMEGIIQSVDKGCCNMFGYEIHELPGKPLTILIPTPYREQHDSYLENYHKTGKKKIIGKIRTLEAQHKDGTIFPIRLSVSEVKTGPTSIFFGMIQKLNDTAAIITADMTGTIINVNQYCENIWGYTVNELIGENVRILMPNPHRDQHDTYLQNYFKTGKMKVIGKVRNVPAMHKSGLIFPVCLQVSRARINNMEYFKGRVERVEEEREGLFTLNADGVILSCNRNTVLPLLGYTEEELKGHHISFLLPQLGKSSTDTEKNLKRPRSPNSSMNTDEHYQTLYDNSKNKLISTIETSKRIKLFHSDTSEDSNSDASILNSESDLNSSNNNKSASHCPVSPQYSSGCCFVGVVESKIPSNYSFKSSNDDDGGDNENDKTTNNNNDEENKSYHQNGDKNDINNNSGSIQKCPFSGAILSLKSGSSNNSSSGSSKSSSYLADSESNSGCINKSYFSKKK